MQSAGTAAASEPFKVAESTSIPILTGEMDGDVGMNDIGSRWSLQSIRQINPTDWYNRQKNAVRSWLEFFNTTRFSLPPSPRRAVRRVIANVDYFQSNYVIIFVILAVYCIVTSPLILLVVLVMLLGFYMVNVRHASQSPVTFFGREIPVFYQYMTVVGLSIPLFIIAKATSAIFWILGASIGIVLVHSALFTPIQSEDSFVQAEV